MAVEKQLTCRFQTSFKCCQFILTINQYWLIVHCKFALFPASTWFWSPSLLLLRKLQTFICPHESMASPWQRKINYFSIVGLQTPATLCYSQNTSRVLRTPETLSCNIQHSELHIYSEKGLHFLSWWLNFTVFCDLPSCMMVDLNISLQFTYFGFFVFNCRNNII